MKINLTQDDADELLSEHLAALGGLVEGFMRDTGLRFGYTLLTFDRNGIKTMGNMPPEAQGEMFTFVALQMTGDGPDSVGKIPVIMPGTH